ncbi:probable RNA-binding protein EIF1AD [Marchantia polymorpha subsp. ruderalis]|uniref:S1-like domain-containing protein n=2 Tax=Marchantia polymorpha TaxID=3197 RepID=A0A176WD18_MARPO|nr:hypothetical protein AXG93_2018s1260 [Marchantia polymorpha subsp. ruderalis]PTQ45699.1 hypothetical protein MARPO_0014s0200 [Marchantia polymorpha]BBM98025.1 hypothetical protein Mp_1g10260 [Marchantia polymorpha subsp. ruderalis]|eukprot:PTQ45699.1 hypothetical protein MARPO_0014s0200 [Marchantia polymorpha]
MSRGRRNLKQGSLEGCPEPLPGQILMRVVAMRGSNVIEVEDADAQKTLCMLPAKFHKSMWIKRGNFVLVDEGDREKAREAGNKVTGTVAQVLYDEHLRELRKTSFWSPAFDATAKPSDSGADQTSTQFKQEANNKIDGDSESDEEEDDGLPPLEANMNRRHAMSLVENSESDSDDE